MSVEPAPKHASHTLRAVIDALAPGIIDVVVAPEGLDVACGQPVLYDPLDPSAVQRDDIVLCAGLRIGDVPQALERAITAGACAVVAKLGDPVPPEIAILTERTSTALLVVPEAFAWGQLYTLLRTASVASPESEPSTDVPLGDLFRLAAAVATMVGGAVTIEDPRAVVLAYHTGDEPIDERRREAILGRRVAETYLRRYRAAGVYERLHRGEVVHIEEGFIEGLRPRLVAAVRAADEVLGSIWVAEGKRPFGSGAEDALREAARITALHLVRHRAAEDLERRRRSDLLQAVLEARTSAEAAAQALGIEPEQPVSVIALHVDVGDQADEAVRTQRVVDLVALHSEAYRRRTAVVAIGRTIYALMPGTLDRARLRVVVADLTEHATKAAGVPVVAAIGPTVKTLADVTRSRAEADRVLRAARSDPRRPHVAEAVDVWATMTLLRIGDLDRRDEFLDSPALAALEQHDTAEGTHYVETLRVYLHAFGDVTSASRALGVHANTFRYRMRRLVELTGLRLDDPDERLVTDLQLRLGDGGQEPST